MVILGRVGAWDEVIGDPTELIWVSVMEPLVRCKVGAKRKRA